MPNLDGQTDLHYPGWNLGIPDRRRIQRWAREFRHYEACGCLPTVEFVYLPQDHTVGTATTRPKPTAMIADNDLALGQLVDAVSHSSYWKYTAIFVVEDDAQDGPDHVDGHRTIAQVISPYTQTGKVDSTFYSTVSMLRTMEMILGVDPMTQFDAAAPPDVRELRLDAERRSLLGHRAPPVVDRGERLRRRDGEGVERACRLLPSGCLAGGTPEPHPLAGDKGAAAPGGLTQR